MDVCITVVSEWVHLIQMSKDHVSGFALLFPMPDIVLDTQHKLRA